MRAERYAWDRLRPTAIDAAAERARPRRVPHDGPFPIEVARDLLAIARALYVIYSGHGPAFANEALKLRGLGAQLHLAIEKARGSTPGTLRHRSAWLIAEDAVRELGTIVGEVRGADLLAATAERLAKKR